MPNRHSIRALVTLLSAMILIRVALQLVVAPDNITSDNCERISPGMSRTEVYGLLQSPGWRPDCGVGIPKGEDPEYWIGTRGTIRVDFDRTERVIRARYATRESTR